MEGILSIVCIQALLLNTKVGWKNSPGIQWQNSPGIQWQNSPGIQGYFATVADLDHILRIKTICQNPNKNSLSYKYGLVVLIT